MIDPEQNISSHRRGSEFASVVITDLARYSPDTNSEKHRMVTLLTDLAHACPTFQAAEASQNVVANSQGDGFVVAFLGDPLGAFHFMQELLKALRNLAPEERLRFGIHVGTLIVQEADIAGKPNMVGEAVDYAARAMSQAKPGQVMLTEAAYWASWQEAINHPFLEPAGRFTIKHGEEIDLYELVEPDSGKQDFWLALAHKTIARSSAKATTLAHPRVIATRFALLAQEFLLLCICLFSIVGLAWALKNLPLVRPLHQASHRLLVNLAPWQETREEPLVILDLERNLTYPNFEGRTNTRDLAKIVEALAELRPSAIGIDIDFGRESKEWQPPFADQGLSSYPDFDHSVARAARAATQSSVPTFLGIDRGITGPDDALIGVDLSDRVSTYDAHFAFVAIVKPTDGTVIDLPLRVLRPAEPKSIPSLTLALATAHLADTGRSKIVGGSRTAAAGPLPNQSRGAELQDFSLIHPKAFEAQAEVSIPFNTVAEPIRPQDRAKIAGKIVLIGNNQLARGLSDSAIRFDTGQEIPGIQVHGAAILSVLKSSLRNGDWPFASLILIILSLLCWLVLRWRSAKALAERPWKPKPVIFAVSLVSGTIWIAASCLMASQGWIRTTTLSECLALILVPGLLSLSLGLLKSLQRGKRPIT